MVSFQCNGCGDVVKKPKLDAHYACCHAPFDCIDCSTTFHTPTEFKGHTSCITEAEKYQKSLYKGPKGKQDQCQGVENNRKGKSNDVKGTDEQGRGESNGESKTTALTSEPPKSTSGPTEVVLVKPKKDKKLKEKKARSNNIIDKKETQATIADPASVPLPPSPEKPSGPASRQSKDNDKKKKKKERELKDGDANSEKLKVDTDENKGGEKVKERKKSRKDATSIVAEAEQDSIRVVEDSAMDVNQPSVYKEKDMQGVIADQASIPRPPSPEKPSDPASLRSKEKDKKRKKEKDPKDDSAKRDKSKVDAEKKMKEGKTVKKVKKNATSVVVGDRAHVEDPEMDVDQTNVQCAEVSEGKKKPKARKHIASTIEVSGENSTQTRVDDPAAAVDQPNVHDTVGSEGKKKRKHKSIHAGKKVDQQGEETKSKKRKRTEVVESAGTKKSKQ